MRRSEGDGGNGPHQDLIRIVYLALPMKTVVRVLLLAGDGTRMTVRGEQMATR